MTDFRMPGAPRPLTGEEWEQQATVGGTRALVVDAYAAPPSRARSRRTLIQKRIWNDLDKDADPSRAVHVRLNPYELAIFQAACEIGGKVQQRISRALIRAWAEAQLGIEDADAADAPGAEGTE